MSEKDKSLETWIWDAACSIRGAQEAPKFKDFILPLIFTKRLCDVFDDELNPNRLGSRLAGESLQAGREGPQAGPVLPAA
jgi:type I restriction enzyme M protein